tara:strand:+ start:42 stop:947 length:906 start_codon:yes stop_codon:yes gene_type:complete
MLMTAVIFIASITLFSVLGANGPEVFNHSDANILIWDADAGDPNMWTKSFNLNSLRSEQQLIYLKIKLERFETDEIPDFIPDQEVKMTSTVNAFGGMTGSPTNDTIVSNEQVFQTIKWVGSDKYSQPVSLFSVSHVAYNNYKVKVSLSAPDDDLQQTYVFSSGAIYAQPDMVYVHTDFTTWSMGWKIAFQVITLFMMFSPLSFCDGLFKGYFVQMRNVSWQYWSDMQCWIGALLVGLFFFNDPLFIFQIYTEDDTTATGLLAFYLIVMGAFISMILCFWLCTSEDIASEGMSQFLARKGAR